MKDDWENKNQIEYIEVTENDIAEVLSVWTGIPVNKLTETEMKRLKELENELHKRVVGQNEAIASVCKAIRRGRVGLKDPKRPIGSFIFLGPTGVGKTETCKALSQALFGDENTMIRIDMSEYMEKHTVSKLIGSPPGYVGFEEGGQLSEKVRKKPYSVVLFDEIEKAHPDVFNILLQILDDGRLTDSQGRLVDFKNTVVIMTSNIGARQISDKKEIGFAGKENTEKNYEKLKTDVMSEVKKEFKPEFLNRIDEIIVFNQLSKEEVSEIVDIMLNMTIERLKDKKIKIKISDELKSEIVKKGFDPIYGARPIKRAIQSMIEDELAEAILDKKIKNGSTVKLEFIDGKVAVI